jgi:hypothetical protein
VVAEPRSVVVGRRGAGWRSLHPRIVPEAGNERVASGVPVLERAL